MKSIVINTLIVGAGSCIGGMSRYIVSRGLQSICNTAFPWGTFLVNILGCLIIGLAYGLIDKGFQLSSEIRLFITVGFCGGFTTFSTFLHENYLLFNSSQHFTILLYAAGSVIAGFIMVWLGYLLVRVIA